MRKEKQNFWQWLQRRKDENFVLSGIFCTFNSFCDCFVLPRKYRSSIGRRRKPGYPLPHLTTVISYCGLQMSV